MPLSPEEPRPDVPWWAGILNAPWSRRWLKPLVVVTYEFLMQLLFALPRYRTLNWLKACFLKLNGVVVGKRVTFYPGVWIAPGRNLTIGDDVDLAKDVLITTTGGVVIGDRVLVGYRTQILSINHRIPPGRAPIIDAGDDYRPVTIGRDAWIGGNCMIMPGVTIGEGAVVAGGSVVTRDVEPFTIVGGIPARLLRRRED